MGQNTWNTTFYDIQYITNVKKLEVTEEKLEVLLGPLIYFDIP